MKKFIASLASTVLAAFLISSPLSLEGIGVQRADAQTAGSAAELALGYTSTKFILNTIKSAVPAGMTISTPDGDINAGNAGRIRKTLEKRLATYTAEIRRRGFVDMGGRYKAKLTRSCTRVPSWTMFVAQGATSFQIRQRGFEVEIIQSKRGDSHSNKMTGVVVEDSLAFYDSLNSDFGFTGVMSGDEITIKPDPRVLRTWPKWANPPKRSDVRSCTVFLTRN